MNNHLQTFFEAANGYRSIDPVSRPLVAHQVVSAADKIDELHVEIDELHEELNRAYSRMAKMQCAIDAAHLASDTSVDHLMIPERHNELMTALADLDIDSFVEERSRG